MKKYTVYQIDSFTKEMFRGNPAGVVVNADGLSERQMQQLARELNNSETAFLLAPDGPDCDGVIRYFTPQTEVPTCGHATVAAMCTPRRWRKGWTGRSGGCAPRSACCRSRWPGPEGIAITR